MPQSDARHATRAPEVDSGPTGRVLRRVTSVAVVVILLLAGAAYQFDLGPRWFGFDYPSPIDEPAEVAPPPGLELPEAAPVGAVAEPTALVSADPVAVRTAVARLARSKKLGRHVAVAVTQLPGGDEVYRSGADRVVPASTLKMPTVAAALSALGRDHRFRTTVVAGEGKREIVLVGGGDPLLARRPVPVGEAYPTRADLQTLARAAARSLRDAGMTRVRLSYDTSLFAGPPVNPAWEASYIPDNVVSPITPLWVDGGREPDTFRRSTDPARAAADVFVRALERRSVTVVGRPRERTAPTDARELAAVEGAPLDQVAQHVLEVSDNESAEVLARHVAIAASEEPSFSGASRAVVAALEGLGVDTSGARILDGSGLARGNRLRPDTLLDLIQVAADDENDELRPVLSGLPVAGFTGSLSARFDTGDDEGLGAVRAKTGTLSRVHGLAGTVTTVDGVVLGFVAVADKVRIPDTLAARALLDELAAALAACTCAASPDGR